MKPCKPSSAGLSERTHEVLSALSDGRHHRGTDLALEMDISRTAVWKHIEALRSVGLDIKADANGYRLTRPPEWLDAKRIRAGLASTDLALEVLFLTDSTNACIKPYSGQPQAVLAEGQRAGRGRRGRDWLSPPGSGVYLSLGWRFESSLTGLAPLSLVAGIAAAQALKDLGVGNIMLKWPNDLLVDGHKLGGCLIDIQGTTDGPCDAAFGIGINVDFGPARKIDQPWTDLRRLGVKISRNDLATELINRLIEHIKIFEHHGFQPLLSHWHELDDLAGRQVRVFKPVGEPVDGQASGIDEHGRLRLLGKNGPTLVSSGEVSVRAV